MKRYLYRGRVLAVLIWGSPHLRENSCAKLGSFLSLFASTAAEGTEADLGPDNGCSWWHQFQVLDLASLMFLCILWPDLEPTETLKFTTGLEGFRSGL